MKSLSRVPAFACASIFLSMAGCNEGAIQSSAIQYFDTAENRRMARAVADGDLREVQLLLDTDAVDVDAVGDNNTGWLKLSILGGRKDVFAFLLSRGAVDAPASPTVSGAMGAAVIADDDHWLRALHQEGASLDAKTNGKPLIFLAIDSGIDDRLEYFVANGADLEASDGLGHTATVTAALADDYDTVIRLLEAGASPWTVGSRGDTLGYWLEYTGQMSTWNRNGPGEAKRQQVIAMLEAAGVPHPPPDPADVVRMVDEGRWPMR